jgi:3-oxoacyl-[acyl-carrier-protein] synthase II
VFVAGMGAITPLARTWAQSAERLSAGQSAVKAVEHFDVSGFPSQVAAAVPDEWLPSSSPGIDRRRRLVEVALAEALEHAGDLPAPERIGVFLGAESGRATPQTILALSKAAGGGTTFDHEQFGKRAAELAPTIDAAAVSPAAVTSWLAGKIGARGPAHSVSIACASGAIAIADAERSIRLGLCDVAICGGVGADVDPLMLVGFGKLGALSERGVSRPFDVHRDGFVVGEGAALVVLSSKASDFGVEITGTGRSLDAHHLTAPDPQGSGAERAMRAALSDAGCPSVGYVQAHGTSTPLNDEVEANAIHRVLSGQKAPPLVSSVKGALGHWIAGAGAVGFLSAVEAVRGRVLPTAGLAKPDPRCPGRHLVVGEETDHDVATAMVNSFAFGGANCSLVVERVTEVPR